MNRELYDLMTKILSEVDSVKSHIEEAKQENGVNLQATERIIDRLKIIAQEADDELNDTLIRIEENFDIEQAKSRRTIHD
ncbi:hypothetical protein WQ57_13985 [Mesobacillus campisalis]|uniref:Uncharacterized protein n=1 Tax=Mesobacillus campisalis TaxID=1408103 RepID=A0A0M2ST52_9BACI|nr:MULTISPECIES: hypothetical protein [Bacillaceae]KKK37313.1 hypothetical protein WQ57_13985 [Mesobacillus campisalis]